MDLGETELLDPHPDIHALFCHYNTLYFEDALGACIVSWSSKRMTLCAGICIYLSGGGCEIRLSEPLLKFRSSADLKNTLLHEMIHAYLWIKNKNKDHSDHGPSFQKLMKEINFSSVIDHLRPNEGYNVTIYHSFHDEVNNYRVHHWRCQSCGDLIKRAMNRKPSPSDCIERVKHDHLCENSSCHWHRHKMSCSGSYEKIAEPPGYKDKSRASKGKQEFDGLIFEESISSTRMITRSAHKTSGFGEKSDPKKSKTIDNFYPVISGTDRNSGSSALSVDHLCNSQPANDQPASEKKSQEHVLPAETFHLGGIHVPKKKRSSNCVGGGALKKFKNDYNVIIGWMGWYANEEEEEDMEPLHNKRTERRRKHRLQNNPNPDILEVKAVYDVSYPGSGLNNSTPSVSNKLVNGGDNRSATCNINSVKQNSVVVEDLTDCKTDLNDSNDCYNLKHTPACDGGSLNTCRMLQLCTAGTTIKPCTMSQDTLDEFGKSHIADGPYEGANYRDIVEISD